MCPPVSAIALRAGVARPGRAYSSYRWKMLAYLIRVFAKAKELSRTERAPNVLEDFSGFQRLLSEIDDQSVWSQQPYALEARSSLMIFLRFLAATTVRRSLRRSPRASVAGRSRPRVMWWHDWSPTCSTGRGVRSTCIARLTGRGGSSRRSQCRITRSGPPRWSLRRQLLTRRSGNTRPIASRSFWRRSRRPTTCRTPRPALRKALVGYNVVDYRVTDTFLKWADEDWTDVGEGLRELARQPGTESIDRFLAHMPREAGPGRGAQLSLASALVMALDPANLPPWRETSAETTRGRPAATAKRRVRHPGSATCCSSRCLDTIIAMVNADAPILGDRLDARIGVDDRQLPG